MLDFQMNNVVVLEKVNSTRRQENIETARRSRALIEAGIRQLTPVDRILIHVAGMLIALGLKLQKRYTFAIPQNTEPHPSKY
jgi:hypothetical protein